MNSTLLYWIAGIILLAILTESAPVWAGWLLLLIVLYFLVTMKGQ